MKTRLSLLLAALSLPFIASAQTVIPQIADGGGWQTTIVITNTSSSSVSGSLTFYQETTAMNTTPWPVQFVEPVNPTALSLGPGGSLFLHTAGVSATTIQGWAQLQGSAALEAYAIFTRRLPALPDQDGTSPAIAPTTRALVPFDNNGPFQTAVAVANPNGFAETITVTVQYIGGVAVTLQPLTIPALGHVAFLLPTQFTGTATRQGLMEMSVASGSLTVLGLRFNNTGAFSTSPVYPGTGSPIIVPGAPSN
jgi:hypothetical protein